MFLYVVEGNSRNPFRCTSKAGPAAHAGMVRHGPPRGRRVQAIGPGVGADELHRLEYFGRAVGAAGKVDDAHRLEREVFQGARSCCGALPKPPCDYANYQNLTKTYPHIHESVPPEKRFYRDMAVVAYRMDPEAARQAALWPPKLSCSEPGENPEKAVDGDGATAVASRRKVFANSISASRSWSVAWSTWEERANFKRATTKRTGEKLLISGATNLGLSANHACAEDQGPLLPPVLSWRRRSKGHEAIRRLPRCRTTNRRRHFMAFGPM